MYWNLKKRSGDNLEIDPTLATNSLPANRSVLVLGGGVVGLTSAYWLAKSGYKVQVVDKGSIGKGTSYANAGYFAFSSGVPFPSWPVLKGMITSSTTGAMKSLQSLMQASGDHSEEPAKLHPVQVHMKESFSDPAFWKWGLHFMKACAFRKDWSAKGEEWSRASEAAMDKFLSWGEVPAESFSFKRCGALRFYPVNCDLEKLEKQIQAANALGHQAKLFNSEQAVTTENVLKPFQAKIGAAIHFKGDVAANCYQYIQEVTKVLTKKYSVQLLENTEVKAIRIKNNSVTGIETAQGEILTADVYVLALGPESTSVAKSIGLDLPIYPLKGYSITIQIPDKELNNPVIPFGVIIDSAQSLYVSRMGSLLRFTSFGEFSGSNSTGNAENIASLKEAAKYFLKYTPIANQVDQGSVWMGKRPLSADGLPIVSACNYSNLYINTGHGAHGWKMAFSSAELLLKIISQKEKSNDGTKQSKSVEHNHSTDDFDHNKKELCHQSSNFLSLDRFLS
mmetsp:Transcript_10489/g.13621  ORF Transcript_10489/g.13621 Transcript_10489/m.13621 type:complete len:507 (-) Transcript_10489:192-1712(-)